MSDKAAVGSGSRQPVVSTGMFGDRGAEFSPCGNYRYKLWRIWDESKPLAMCIGLNPSRAGAEKNDTTIIWLRQFILPQMGFGGFYMTNLFAWISPKPQDLLRVADPLGDNNRVLKEVEKLCSEVIFCWGNFKQAEKRMAEVLPEFPNAKCFGFNSNGSPCHPLAFIYNKQQPKLQNYWQ